MSGVSVNNLLLSDTASVNNPFLIIFLKAKTHTFELYYWSLGAPLRRSCLIEEKHCIVFIVKNISINIDYVHIRSPLRDHIGKLEKT
jgi:hypothetical protein